MKYDAVIIGGGIVGLSTGMAIYERYPDAKIAVIEKEKDVALHQTGNNSGVIHSGIYYTPGSFKARFAKQGSKDMQKFCKKHHINYDMCGKVIVATTEEELPLLDNLYQRGLENNLTIEKIDATRLKEIEPHVRGLAAIHVPQAGIVDYREVSRKFAEIITNKGGDLFLNTEFISMHEAREQVTVKTNKGSLKAKLVINCAGLHSDRVAEAAGYLTDMKIVPFRGEYFSLKPEKQDLVKTLIYPVPNPKFPFLGVHFTKMIDGTVEAGPNAVLGFKREAYKKTDISLKDTVESLKFPGLWKLGSKFLKEGIAEYTRSLSKTQFTKSLQALVPEIEKDDLISAPAGVRAQALTRDGVMVDDFQIIDGKRSIHVCNAPSPAATASIGIGKEVARRVELYFNIKNIDNEEKRIGVL
ncbi:L-2-hydroxyglutarate oxidase [Cerasibacillus terrae]|uniref:L-2-hydroxyglutarate oxidase n=1 Tax=Cerasibacillus terrae TaxID=2498845 RepID=A0A5C8NXQ1_9BACI|nr:L-2-hydroxyglutarate oxidase [Cerasibacillus terrae]TXL65811.1 L-2-hydroxyglutarate oxidase [Cerasibacillus terrae]